MAARRPRLRRPRAPGRAGAGRRGLAARAGRALPGADRAAGPAAERLPGGARRAGAGRGRRRPRSAAPADGEAPLLGVPIAVKDTHDVAGELTTHGTGCVDEPAAEDSELVQAAARRGRDRDRQDQPARARLRDVHRIAHLGRDPQSLEHGRGCPGGSSGGSGAAVAAGLAAAATASDGAGSIRYPGRLLLAVRAQAAARTGPARPQARALARDVRQRVPDPQRPRHGALPRRHRRRRPRAREAPAARAAPSPRRRGPRPESCGSPSRSRAPARSRPRCWTSAAARAVEETAELLGSLGHQVTWRDPEVGNGGQRRLDPLLARRRRRRPPASQPRAAGPAGARASPAWGR